MTALRMYLNITLTCCHVGSLGTDDQYQFLLRISVSYPINEKSYRYDDRDYRSCHGYIVCCCNYSDDILYSYNNLHLFLSLELV